MNYRPPWLNLALGDDMADRRDDPDQNIISVMGKGAYYIGRALLFPVIILIEIGGKIVRWIVREDERG
jgi:hypothetical protein